MSHSSWRPQSTSPVSWLAGSDATPNAWPRPLMRTRAGCQPTSDPRWRVGGFEPERLATILDVVRATARGRVGSELKKES